MPITIKRKVAAPAPEAVVPEPPKPQPKEPGKVCDGMALAVFELAPNSAIPWFLMASYLYYIHDVSLLSDALYDQMAKAILEAWDELEHDHKHLIRKSDLTAGSLYRLKATDYPNRTKAAAVTLADSQLGMKIKYIPT